MAKTLRKIQRYFSRKPVRFFSLILLYLTAGSFLFLHAGFVGDSPRPRGVQETLGASEMDRQALSSDTRGLGITSRRYGPPWMKRSGQEGQETVHREGDFTGEWNRALKGRSSKDVDDARAKYIGCYIDDTQKRTLKGISFFDYKKMTLFRCQDNCAERGYMYAGLEFGAECYCGHKIQAPNASESECNMECKGDKSSLCGGANRLSTYRLELSQESVRRYGSAIFKGCFHRPDNVTLALPFTTVIQNMSVSKCLEMCTDQKKPLAALAGDRCYCGFPTSQFSLHDPEKEDMCFHRCQGEEFESCGNDEYFVVYQTQVPDHRCMDRKFLPTPAKELVALTSFPGSGNTWTRHLIELATGFYTGSVYFDGSLYNKEFKGEKENWQSRRTICVKTHEKNMKNVQAFQAGILLIRNPYKALMAEFNRQHGGHTGFASPADWSGKDWPNFVWAKAPKWASHVLDWLLYGKKVKVILYEDLKTNVFSTLKEMVQFLDLEVSEDRLLCVEGQKDGNFKRSGLRKLEYDPYTPAMEAIMNELIRKVDAALKERKLPGIAEEYVR